MVLLTIADGDDLEVGSWEDLVRSQLEQLEQPGVELLEDWTKCCRKLSSSDYYAC